MDKAGLGGVSCKDTDVQKEGQTTKPTQTQASKTRSHHHKPSMQEIFVLDVDLVRRSPLDGGSDKTRCKHRRLFCAPIVPHSLKKHKESSIAKAFDILQVGGRM